jgi:hypothetical protein
MYNKKFFLTLNTLLNFLQKIAYREFGNESPQDGPKPDLRERFVETYSPLEIDELFVWESSY